MIDVTKALNDADNDLSRSIDNQRLERNMLRAKRKPIRALATKVAKHLAERDYLWVGMVCETPNINVYMRDLTGFKDERLTGLLSMLADIGITERTSDCAEILNRAYRFRVDDMNVRIDAYVMDESPTCRKVQIGEEIRVVPKYQIECD
jgi:hypothetical protein